MKSTSELTDFYYKTLYPTLESLEKQRKNVRDRVVVVGILYTLASIALFFLLSSFKNLPDDFFSFFAVAYFGLGAIIYKFLTKEYTSDFKNRVIEPLIHAIDEGLSYMSDLHIPTEYFTKSELFGTFDKIEGNDYVKGIVNDVPIEFSDLHAQKRHVDSKGRERWDTIFQGLFIVSEFNKNFQGKTVVLPDTAQNLFGDLIGGWLQSNNIGRGELVKLDDIEFEKEFVVYSTDQIEARYILSHSLMQRLLTFKQKSKHPLYVSFVGESIHMAIYYNKDLFEASVFHSLLNYKIAMEYVTTLHLAISIVDELKLNQKLWSKQ